jgi:uncharacterized protein (DUF2235 family)
MALYAFDGTWNVDEVDEMKDSNVRKFGDAYTGLRFYLEGIGTRHGFVGKFVGGATGKGGRIRVGDAMDALEHNVAAGDRDIDIIGFSRGAALALHFANEIDEEMNGAQIRFLGLWDVVASFGLPGNDLNINWTLTLPKNVSKCYHAMALDERREHFPLTRVREPGGGAPAAGRLQEVWFRGVHSDVGGSATIGLCSIALGWMLRRAKAHGLPIDDAAIRKWEAECKPDAPIWINNNSKPGPWRSIEPGDAVHESVRPRGTAGQTEHNDPPADVVIARG